MYRVHIEPVYCTRINISTFCFSRTFEYFSIFWNQIFHDTYINIQFLPQRTDKRFNIFWHRGKQIISISFVACSSHNNQYSVWIMPILVMIEAIQIASIGALWLVVILLYGSQAEASGVGRFSLLMPNVRPYRVSRCTNLFFVGNFCS